MKMLTITGVALALCVCGAVGSAQEKADGGDRADVRKQILEKFDKDGDGKLSDEEKAAARKAFANRGDQARPAGGQLADRFKEIVAKYDKDGDGKLNEAERTAAREELSKLRGAGDAAVPNRQELMKKFDKNGDGKLDDEERAALRKELAQRGGLGGAALNREEVMKKFDKNGNGKIDEDEREALRKFITEQRGQDRPVDGKPADRPANRVSREQLLEKYDANKNGQIDPEERQKAIEDLRKGRAADRPKRPADDKE